MLILAEELLLLAFQEQKAGALNCLLPQGLAGAVLVELLMKNKIARKGTYLAINENEPGGTGDILLDQALSLMVSAGREESTRYWRGELTSELRHLKARLTDRLRYKGFLAGAGMTLVLDKTELLSTVHGIWAPRVRRVTELLPHSRDRLRFMALIGLAKVSGLMILAEEERRIGPRRIRRILGASAVAEAVAETIADMEHTEGMIATAAANG
jgi:Golgi phosphoprotein 3 GPP34